MGSEYLPGDEEVLVELDAKRSDDANIGEKRELKVTPQRVIYESGNRVQDIDSSEVIEIEFIEKKFSYWVLLGMIAVMGVSGVAAGVLENPLVMGGGVVVAVLMLVMGLLFRKSTIKIKTASGAATYRTRDTDAAKKVPHAVRRGNELE
jgi:hypothetical protein